MTSLYQFLATSDHPAVRAAPGLRRRIQGVTLPAPQLVVKPMLWTFLALRWPYYLGRRLLICEPLFKAYCRRYGRGSGPGSTSTGSRARGISSSATTSWLTANAPSRSPPLRRPADPECRDQDTTARPTKQT